MAKTRVWWAPLAGLALAGAAHAGTQVFTNNTPLPIPGTTVGSSIAVSGVFGTVTDVDVALTGLGTNGPAGIEELDLLVVAPNVAQGLILFSFACDATLGPISVVFDNAAGGPAPSGQSGSPCVTGATYLPSDYSPLVGGYILDPPAPAPPYSTNLGIWNGANPNGTWNLYAEEFGGNEGAVLQGWELRITSTDPVDLSLTKTVAPPSVSVGQAVTFTITVANAGPDPASGVVVTDNLPAGLAFVSTSGCAESPAGGVPTCTLGTIPALGQAQYTIVATATGSVTGAIVNIATASTASEETNPGNDSGQATLNVTDFVPIPIPTASELGLLALALSTAAAGIARLRRRR